MLDGVREQILEGLTDPRGVGLKCDLFGHVQYDLVAVGAHDFHRFLHERRQVYGFWRNREYPLLQAPGVEEIVYQALEAFDSGEGLACISEIGFPGLSA